jgi:hypothetical protein
MNASILVIIKHITTITSTNTNKLMWWPQRCGLYQSALRRNQMQTTVKTPVLHFTASGVVKNDPSAVSKANPSIEVGAKTMVKAAVDKSATAIVQSPLARLQSMETATRNWEATELAASNKRLYSILTDAYSFYLTMKSDPVKETRFQYLKDLEQFIAQRRYVFAPTSHDMTRVVKCVFGVDRRRVSAYSIALREALNQKTPAEDLAAFFELNGGVEQIRLGGTKPLSAKVRAGKVKDEVLNAELGNIKFDSRFVRADADWADKQVVIVATCLPTGEFQANAVIRHDTAVNAALAAYYSQQQAAARAEAKAQREAEKQEAAELKEADAKAKVSAVKQTTTSTKEQKQAKQKTKMSAKKKEQARVAANAEHASSLIEEALA